MSKITKPDISIQWAQAGVIVTPSDAKKQTGWVVEKPAYDYMNWLQNRQDTAIAYTYQMGIPEWDSATEYQYAAGYATYIQYNGIVYKALQVSTNKNPASETSYWVRAFDSYGSASTVNSALTTHITNYGTLASLSNATTARSNLSVYSIAQIDAAFAPIAGNSAQTFLVGSASSANHAVRKSQFDAKTGQADETTAGIMEVATQAETNAEISDVASVTPKKLGEYITQRVATEARSGVLEIATQAETNTGTDDERVVTPKKLRWGVSTSIGANGYIMLPSWLGGIILQWGRCYPVSGDVGGHTVSFPLTFPTALYHISHQLIGNSDGIEGNTIYVRNNFTTSSFRFTYSGAPNSYLTANGIFWFAIGV